MLRERSVVVGGVSAAIEASRESHVGVGAACGGVERGRTHFGSSQSQKSATRSTLVISATFVLLVCVSPTGPRFDLRRAARRARPTGPRGHGRHHHEHYLHVLGGRDLSDPLPEAQSPTHTNRQIMHAGHCQIPAVDSCFTALSSHPAGRHKPKGGRMA